MEVVILWIIHLLEYFSKQTGDVNLSVFNMTKRTNESKILTKHISSNVNINLMIENVTKIKSGITKKVDLRAKICSNIICVKNSNLES